MQRKHSAPSAALLTAIVFSVIANGQGVRARDGEQPQIRLEPRYPAAALEQRLEGHVTMEFTITAEGKVQDIEVIDASHSLFQDAAVNALSRWRYWPQQGASPVEGQRIQETLEFRLPDSGR